MKNKCIDCGGGVSLKSTLRCRSCWVLFNRGPNHRSWVGGRVSYHGLHDYIKAHLVKPQKCQKCNQNKKLDLANKSQKYLRDLSDWEWLCRKCHMQTDGRLARFRSLKRLRDTTGRYICVR